MGQRELMSSLRKNSTEVQETEYLTKDKYVILTDKTVFIEYTTAFITFQGPRVPLTALHLSRNEEIDNRQILPGFVL